MKKTKVKILAPLSFYIRRELTLCRYRWVYGNIEFFTSLLCIIFNSNKFLIVNFFVQVRYSKTMSNLKGAVLSALGTLVFYFLFNIELTWPHCSFVPLITNYENNFFFIKCF